MKSEKKIAILILAAGEASRMGTPKQLLPWKNTTLLGQVIENAKSTKQGNVFVVLGAYAAEIRKQFSVKDVSYVIHKDWKKGLGSSIAAGVQHIVSYNPGYKAVLLLLGDQPFVDAAYLELLISTFRKSDEGIVATGYGQKTGVPAIFDQVYFNRLTSLGGDIGAKHILEERSTEVVSLNANGLTTDVDTMTEYERLKDEQP